MSLRLYNTQEKVYLYNDCFALNAWKVEPYKLTSWLCVCVIQSQYLCWRLWEDGAEEDPEGSVEDRPEQPGENHRPASEQRQPGKHNPKPNSSTNSSLSYSPDVTSRQNVLNFTKMSISRSKDQTHTDGQTGYKKQLDDEMNREIQILHFFSLENVFAVITKSLLQTDESN